MAEQRTEDEKKKQEELRVQYEKEQDLYNNRSVIRSLIRSLIGFHVFICRLLVSTESKEKLSLNFMYEAPPGAKKGQNRASKMKSFIKSSFNYSLERQKEDDEPEYKFEWQRNAPRERSIKHTSIHYQ